MLMEQPCLLSIGTPKAQECPVLLLSNDPAVESATLLALENDYCVIAANSTSEAEKILNAREIGILICEEHLASEQGLGFMLETRGSFPAVQPILVSEGIDEDLISFAINDVGVLKYLKKPLDRRDIRKAVEAAASHYRKALAASSLNEMYQQMAREMHGLPYALRRFRRSMHILTVHSRDFFASALTTAIAINLVAFGLGVITLGGLYLLKTFLGINVLEQLHLEDLLI